MSTQTLSTADAILKELYVGPIIEQVNYKTYLLDRIDRDSDHVDFTGRRAIVPVESAANPSRSSFGDGGTLVTPGAESYLDAIIPIKYHDAGFEITDQTVKQSKPGDGAFASLMERGAKNVAKVMKKNLNRQAFGDGSALLGAVTASSSAAVVTVDGTQFLKVKDRVDVLTRSTGAVVSNGTERTVISIDRTAKTVTLDGNVTVTNLEGLYLSGAFGFEMQGLKAFAGKNRTLFGINSATSGNEFWNGIEKDAASAVAGESLFEQLADDVGAGGQDETGVFLTTRGIRRRLADTYQSLKRFNDAQAVEIHGGYSAIMVNEVPVIFDDDVPKGDVYSLPKDLSEAFKWFQVAPMGWLESEDGTIWQLATGSVAGTRRAAWQAWFVWYASLGCTAPNRVGRIKNCQDESA